MGTALSAVSGLAITIFLTRALGVSGYGSVAVAVAIAGVIQGFTNLGLANAVARMMSFAQAEGDQPRAMRMFKSALMVGGGTGLSGIGVMVALGAAGVVKGGTSDVLIILAPLVLASSLRATMFGALRAFRNLRAIFITGVISPILDLILVAGLLLLGIRDATYFAGAIMVSAYIELGIVVYFVRRGRSIGKLTDTTLADTKALLAFSLPLVITNLMLFAMKSMDVLLLGVVQSSADAGLYSPVMRLMDGASKGLSAFPVLFVPIAAAYVAQGKIDQLRDLYLSVTKLAYAVGFPVLLVLLVAPAYVLGILFGAEYRQMDTVARILVLAYATNVITGLNSLALGALGAVKQMAWFSLTGIAMSVGSGLLLINLFGKTGAAWSNVLSYGFANIAYSVLLYRRSKITPFRKDTVALFVYSAIVAGAGMMLVRIPVLSKTGPTTAVVALALLAWIVGVLFIRSFHMQWSEIMEIFRRRKNVVVPAVPLDESGADARGV